MKKILRWLIWVPLVVIIAVFLIANRQPVSISLDPMTIDNPAIATPALPLWLWLSLSLLTGFFVGAFGMWNSGRAKRVRAKAQNRELKSLKRDLASPTQKAATATQSSDLPTLQAS